MYEEVFLGPGQNKYKHKVDLSKLTIFFTVVFPDMWPTDWELVINVEFRTPAL